MLGALLLPGIRWTQGALITLGLLGCVALVLIPAPLMEMRYLTLPALLLRLHAPPLRGPAEWAPPLAAFAFVNAAAIATFLLRPYVWVDGTEARFMW